MSIATKYSTLVPLSAAVVALAVSLPACDQARQPQTQQGGSTRQQSQPPQPQTPQAQSNIVLEVTGSGEVYAIWSEPFGQVAGDHTTMPFSKSFPLPADEDYVSLTWTTRDDAAKGCKITVDNKVVVENPLGTTEDCVFKR